MIRHLTALIILLSVVLSTTAMAGSSRYLVAPAVKWENNRLTGAVKNVPIQTLLEELLGKEGYQWEVKGNLSGKIGLSFDDMTIEESIRKIMRLGKYNYALIHSTPASPENSSSPQIKELTIYQKDDTIRFSRTSQKFAVPSKKANIRTVRKPRKPKKTAASVTDRAIVHTKAKKLIPEKPSNEELAEMDRQFKEMADEMLAAKEISQEEYAQMMKEMQEITKIIKEEGFENN